MLISEKIKTSVFIPRPVCDQLLEHYEGFYHGILNDSQGNLRGRWSLAGVHVDLTRYEEETCVHPSTIPTFSASRKKAAEPTTIHW